MNETPDILKVNKTEICRACLSVYCTLQSIFQVHQIDYDCFTISSMITAITSIEINLDDKLPNSICESCIDETIRLYKFRKQCINSQIFLTTNLTEDQTLDIVLNKKNDEIFENTSELSICYPPMINDSSHEKAISNIAQIDKNIIPIEPKSDFNCEVCSKVFKNSHTLKHHLKKHLENNYSCNLCNKKFKTNIILKKHLKLHDPNYPFKCKACGKISSCLTKHNAHNKVHCTEKQFSCEICGKALKTKYSLEEHMKIHSILPLLDYRMKKIDIENNTNNNSELISKNINIIEYKRLSELPLPKVENFINGRNLNDNEIQQTLKFISRPFITKLDGILYRKFRTVNKTFQHECPKCYKLSSKTTGLKSHFETHNTEKKYLCDICGEKFTSLSKQKEHYLKHSEIHKCNQCQKSFPSKSQLDTHLIVHTGQKPFKCDLCDARFTQKSTIKVHKNLVHSDVRPFKCNICPATFKLNSKLLSHKRSHLDVKPFKCYICNKEFTRRESFKIHSQIHSKDKKFKCDICFKTFAVNLYFKRHQNWHKKALQQL